MRRQDNFRRWRFECHSPLSPDHGVAQVDAAPDAERSRQRFELFDDRDRGFPDAVKIDGNARREADGVPFGRTGVRERVLRKYPGVVRNAAVRGQRFFAADGDAPEAAVHRIGGAERRDGKLAVLEIFELFRPLEGAVADGRNDLKVRRQRAQRDFEADLVVTRRRAAVRDHRGLERKCHLSDGLGLQYALGANAQRIQAPPSDVAHDEEFEYLVEIRRARIEQMMLEAAEFNRPQRQALRSRRVDAAGIDGHGNHRTSISLLEPGHTERGVQTAGKGQKNGLSARVNSRCHRVYRPKMARRRSPSSRCSRTPAVAMNIVSSPEMVPTTSGQRAVSMATATLWAAPMVVFSTVRLVPAVKRALTNCFRVEKSFLGGSGASGSTYRSPSLATPNSRRSRLTLDCVATCPCLRSMATNSDCRPTTCSRMIFASTVRRAGALELPLSEGGLESITRAPVHKFARSLHKNASSVNRRVA